MYYLPFVFVNRLRVIKKHWMWSLGFRVGTKQFFLGVNLKHGQMILGFGCVMEQILKLWLDVSPTIVLVDILNPGFHRSRTYNLLDIEIFAKDCRFN